MQELEGHPEALQGFSLEALRVLVRDIGHGQDRARHALEHAESLSSGLGRGGRGPARINHVQHVGGVDAARAESAWLHAGFI